MWNTLKKNVHYLNESKFLLGIAMILINVGSKYIEFGFSKTQEEAIRNGIGREILIFAMVFMGTRDLIISIMMTAAFIILSNYIFNEKSKFCMISNSLQNISRKIDKNNDNIISPEEERNALEILERAEKQKQKHSQSKFTSYMSFVRDCDNVLRDILRKCCKIMCKMQDYISILAK